MEEQLIEFVKANPFIWDKQNRYYKNTYLRNTKFAEIAEELNVPVEKAKLRWKTLKDKYHKERKSLNLLSGSEAFYSKKLWKWMDLMSFLGDVSSANIGTPENCSQTNNTELINFIENTTMKSESLQSIPEKIYSSTLLDEELRLLETPPTSCSDIYKRKMENREEEDSINQSSTRFLELITIAKDSFAREKTVTQLFFEAVAKQVDDANLSSQQFCKLQIEILKILNEVIHSNK